MKDRKTCIHVIGTQRVNKEMDEMLVVSHNFAEFPGVKKLVFSRIANSLEKPCVC